MKRANDSTDSSFHFDLAPLELGLAEQLVHVLLGAPQDGGLGAGRGRHELRDRAELPADRALRRPAGDGDDAARPETRRISAAVRSWSGANMWPKVRRRGRSWRRRTAVLGSASTKSTSTMASAARSRASASSPGAKSSAGRPRAGLGGGDGGVARAARPRRARPSPARRRRARRQLACSRMSVGELGVACVTLRRSAAHGAVNRTAATVRACHPGAHGLDRDRGGRAPPLWRGRRGRGRARRRDCRVRARSLQRDHGPVRVWQVHADAHPRRARPAHVAAP